MQVSDRQVRRWGVAAVQGALTETFGGGAIAESALAAWDPASALLQTVARVLWPLVRDAAQRRGMPLPVATRLRLFGMAHEGHGLLLGPLREGLVCKNQNPNNAARGASTLASAATAALSEVARASVSSDEDGDIQLIARLHEALVDFELVRDESGALKVDMARGRKRSGAFFTPPALCRGVVATALEHSSAKWSRVSAAERQRDILQFRVCDPAMGAGAFLLEACRALAAELEPEVDGIRNARGAVLRACIHGMDVNPLSVAVAEACLWLFAGDVGLDPSVLEQNLRAEDALTAGVQNGSFDLVVGNPPWVAYAGRAAQPLPPEKRAELSRRFRAMRGYPTLHGLFVERAVELAPRGVVALLLPSPVADLEGYRAVREVVTARHRVRDAMVEFGQDAFASVTQPCFALIAEADASAAADGRPWRLSERQRAHAPAATVEVPEALLRLNASEALPGALFGEMGFQTCGGVSQKLLQRSEAPDERHTYPLLEGRDVTEFRQGAPRLYLDPDPVVLREARCRLRDRQDYQRVKFVVRQTARFPIAALHGGLPFRNTLLAGFEHPELDAPLMVGLLNSTLYRALHVARERDARQAVFPQVKIRHLRALPLPPGCDAGRQRVRQVSARATESGMRAELRRELDAAVFELFAIDGHEGEGIRLWLEQVQGSGRPAAR